MPFSRGKLTTMKKAAESALAALRARTSRTVPRID
jgi:hypothetical protein